MSIRPACDRGRLAQALPCLEEDERRDPEQHDRVDDRGQDLEPQVPERPIARCRPLGEPDRREGQADPAEVRRHVPGVGEEREAVRDDAADQLEQEDHGRDREDDDEPATPGARGGSDPVGHQRALTGVERSRTGPVSPTRGGIRTTRPQDLAGRPWTGHTWPIVRPNEERS